MQCCNLQATVLSNLFSCFKKQIYCIEHSSIFYQTKNIYSIVLMLTMVFLLGIEAAMNWIFEHQTDPGKYLEIILLHSLYV